MAQRVDCNPDLIASDTTLLSLCRLYMIDGYLSDFKEVRPFHPQFMKAFEEYSETIEADVWLEMQKPYVKETETTKPEVLDKEQAVVKKGILKNWAPH